MTWLVIIVPRCTVLVACGRDVDRFVTRSPLRGIGRVRVSVDTYPSERIVTRWGISTDRW